MEQFFAFVMLQVSMPLKHLNPIVFSTHPLFSRVHTRDLAGEGAVEGDEAVFAFVMLQVGIV